MFKNRLIFLVMITSILSQLSCNNLSESKASDLSTVQLASQKYVSIMSYNVENLFDTKDDPGKKDETYLPKKLKQTNQFKNKCKNIIKSHWKDQCLNMNWDNKVLFEKMRRLSRVIESYGSKGPDILVLQEVENLSVLEEFRKKHLASLGYQYSILLEGEDERGIDVGVISKIKPADRGKLHKINFSAIKKLSPRKRYAKTRSILEVTFDLGDSKLKILGVHFPSQGSPTPMRKRGLEKLNEIKKSFSEKDFVVVAGDFNITSYEDSKHNLFSKVAGKEWLVGHHIAMKNERGTNYYHRKKSWSFFDAFLFSKNLDNNQSWEVLKKETKVYNQLSIQNTKYNTPARFDMGKKGVGVSDHWPIVTVLKNSSSK